MLDTLTTVVLGAAPLAVINAEVRLSRVKSSPHGYHTVNYRVETNTAHTLNIDTQKILSLNPTVKPVTHQTCRHNQGSNRVIKLVVTFLCLNIVYSVTDQSPKFNAYLQGESFYRHFNSENPLTLRCISNLY